MIVVSTPRHAVVHKALIRASFGTKYGVEMTSSRRAANIRPANISDIAEARTVGPVPITWAGMPPAPKAGSGRAKQSARSSGA